MLAVVSSTLFPSHEPVYWGSPRTCIPSSERLNQTIKTISSLQRAGINRILLLDNSGTNWISGTEKALLPAEVHVFNHHQFQNKGISEIYLLLRATSLVPSDTPILKISGRYYLTTDFDHTIDGADIVARVTKRDGVNLWMSTRCYLVRNVTVFEMFWRAVLRDLYGYGARIVGPRSLLRILSHSVMPHKKTYPFDDPVQGIEVPAARVLKRGQFNVRLVDRLGVEGTSSDYAQRLISE